MRLNSSALSRAVAFLVSFGWLQSVLEKPECYREMQKLEHTFLLRDHFFPRLRDALRQVFEKKSLILIR